MLLVLRDVWPCLRQFSGAQHCTVAMSPRTGPHVLVKHGEPPRLSRPCCYALLAQASSGHLALSQGALPLVVPVTCALDGDRLLVRAGRGLLGRVPSQPGIVAFETAGAKPGTTWRWEVLVQGRAEVVNPAPGDKSPPELALLDNELTTALCISMERVSGWKYGTPSGGQWS